LLISATLGLDPDRAYAEDEINNELHRWTTLFGTHFDLDHVALRRFLIDEQYIARDAAGTTYTLAAGDAAYTIDPSIRALDPETLVDAARREREERKRRYLQQSQR